MIFTRDECEAVLRRLWPYLDDTLDPADRERVAAHLADCEACTAHVEFSREFLAAVRNVRRDDTAFDELAQRVRRALVAEGLPPAPDS